MYPSHNQRQNSRILSLCMSWLDLDFLFARCGPPLSNTDSPLMKMTLWGKNLNIDLLAFAPNKNAFLLTISLDIFQWARMSRNEQKWARMSRNEFKNLNVCLRVCFLCAMMGTLWLKVKHWRSSSFSQEGANFSIISPPQLMCKCSVCVKTLTD